VAEASPPAWRERLLPLLDGLAILAIFGIALVALRHELHAVRWRDVRQAIVDVPLPHLLVALLATVASYGVQSLYDWLAFRHLGQARPWRELAPTAIAAQVLSQSLGIAVLTGGALRSRVYGRQGLGAAELAQLIGFVSVSFWLGFLALGGTLLLITAPALPGGILPVASGRLLGGILLALALAWPLVCALRPGALRIRAIELRLPGPGTALAQSGLSSVDWALSAIAFLALLPALPDPLGTAGLLLLAHLLAAVSHVPGGVGVFESALVVLLHGRASGHALLGAALLYRVIYTLLPLSLVAIAGAAAAVRAQRGPLEQARSALVRAAQGAAPRLAGAAAIAGGLVLLLSSATPAVPERLAWLRGVVPLGVIEASHLLGVASGAGLLVVGRGLWHRLHEAWLLAVALLLAGVLASAGRGLDWVEGLLLLGATAVVLTGHRTCDRPSKLSSLGPSAAAWMGMMAVLLAMAWLGDWHHPRIAAWSAQWTRFAWAADAARFLRGMGLASTVLAVGGLAWGVRRHRWPTTPAQGEVLEAAIRLALAAPATQPWLVLLGDKEVILDEGGEAFIMFGHRGHSRIAMGAPVGQTRAARELAWDFIAQAREDGLRPVFYSVGVHELPLMLDLGLVPFKLGEEALVPLHDFSLEGSRRRDLRQALRKAEEREGASFEVLPAPQDPAILDAIQQVSQDWMAEKHVAEKGFSLGAFSRPYLARCDIAVVRVEGRIVAFANLWASGGHEELSVDLMRYRSDAPKGIMDYLFTRLMLHGHAQGYARFSLGMAPLSGVEARPGAPLWHTVASLAWQHGEHFYNFEGLRAYKEKFDPTWSPRFLMISHAMQLPAVLADLVALTSGGIEGALHR